MQLRFNETEILAIAGRYPVADDEILKLKPPVQKRGFLQKHDLEDIACWKAPRSAGHVRKNEDEYVRELTRFALWTTNERARIEVLTALTGVSWPTASVILHLFHREPYPILDFRALWSVSLEVPNQYSFDLWWPYVQFCRNVAQRNKVDMRTLDKALWQYSKEGQRRHA